MNKIDLLSPLKRESLIDTDSVVHISAQKGEGLERLLEHIDRMIEQDPISRVHWRVPQSEGRALAAIDARAVVLGREYRDGYVEIEADAPESLLRQLERFLAT